MQELENRDRTLKLSKSIEVIDKKRRKSKSEFKTFIAFEKAQKVKLIDGEAAAKFQLSESESLPNNFDFQEPDYWELEVSDKGTGFFSRFVLDSL